MRSNQPGPASITKLVAVASLGLAALAAGCTPNLEDKLVCDNSTQCPTGYFCAADGKCQQGDTVPEITVLTQTSGITFSGTIALEISVIDPAGVSTVTVGLAGPGGDAGSPIAATAAQNNIYNVTLDTRALGIASSGTFTATITATNAKGKTSTATVQLTVNDQAPTITAIAVTPANVSAGQAATITFNTGEALTDLPIVKLTPPDGSAPRHAAYVSVTTDHTYTYQFVPLSTDPLGSWKVQITAQDSLGNSASSPGNDAFNVTPGGAQAVTFSAVRMDGIADARAYALKSGATTTITASFGVALGASPSGFLCPVGTPGPCTASTTGAMPVTASAGTSPNSYVFIIPAITGSKGSPSEGTHVFTVTGSSGGSAISGSVNVVYDFTPPTFGIQQVDGDQQYDDQGRMLASKSRFPNGIHYLLTLNETPPEAQPPTWTLDGAPSALLAPAAHPDSALLPEETLTLDGSLASRTPVSSTDGHHVSATVCDAANNCSPQPSETFVEVDSFAKFAVGYPNELDPPLSDGGVNVHKAGETVTVEVEVDRTLGDSSDVDMSVQLVNTSNGDTIYFPDQPLADPTPGPAATPFVYDYSTQVPQGISDGTYAVEVTSGTDGYGNSLLPGASPFVQTTAPFVTIKTSVPQLFGYTPASGPFPASQYNPIVGNGPTAITFVAESNGVAGAYEDLSKGTITVCVNPNITGAALVCPSGSTNSNNGLTATIKPPSGNSPGANPVPNFLGEVDLTAVTTAGNGNQFVLINYTDAAGNIGALPINVDVVTQPPSLLGYQFDKTVVGTGQTATATVTISGLGYVSGGNAGTLTGVTATASQLSSNTYSVAFKMPGTCAGGNNPTNGVPFPVFVTLGNASNPSINTQIGSLTCAASSIANATVASSLVTLVKQPLPDGTVRSIVSAAPGTISGISSPGAPVGVTLVAQQGATVLGSGVVNADGSVSEFQIAGALTQVSLHFADLLGNSRPVLAGYPEQLLINGTGANAISVSNPFQLTDVSTGDDTFYAAPYWVDGGPGVDGGVAGPVKAGSLPDGGGPQTAASAEALLASIDNQSLQLASSKAFDSDAGPYRPTPIGAEIFGNPLVYNGDGGLVPQVSPPARSNAMMGAYGNTLYLYGGTGDGGGQFVDPVGTVWEWQRDTGWTKNVVTVFDGGTPSYAGSAAGFDQSGNVLVIGGGSGIAGLYTNYLADGGISQYWGDAGTIGTPLGNGQVTPSGIEVSSSATGYGAYSYLYPYSTQADGGPIYQSYGTQMTVMNTYQSPTNNCLITMSGCGGSGQYYCPGGTLPTFGCYSASGGLAGSQHSYAALAVANASAPDGGIYGLFSFGGKFTASNGYVSNDFYGGSLSYADGGLSVTWTPLSPSNGVIPPARYMASLTYEPSTNRVNLYGGESSTQVLTDNWEYDLATGNWTQIDNTQAGAIVPPPRIQAATASVNGNLYLFGGSASGAVYGDAWTLGREARNRFIARLPIASQLTSPAAAVVSSLTITLANPSSRFVNGRTLEGHSPELATPELTFYDGGGTADLYLWTGTSWQLIEDTGYYVQQITLPASTLPSITAGDGNLYVMVAGAPVGYPNQTPPPIVLDALDFTLNFQ